MCKKLALTAAITLLLLSPAYSGDLYVLGIKDEATLTAVKGIVPNAYGMIGDKFIVELNSEQFQRLDSAGIKAEFVASNFTPERFFIVGQLGTPGTPKGVLLTARYQSGGAYIVELSGGEIDILRQEGYMVIPMKGKKTPFFYKPEVANLRFLDTYPSDSLADLVSLDSLYSYDSRLAAFETRYMFSDSINSARDWIMEKFLSFGYTDVKYDTFYTGISGDIPDKPLHNVICIKPGVTYPEKLIIVGAHYDSYNGYIDPMLVAPGADDNASGTSGVLELARILKDVTFDKTIIFTAFSGEELGLYGSKYMAAKFYEQQADIEVMINMDMIGYDPDSNYKVELEAGL
ncbi:MAG: M20/M25/M40 family metallo-hydrolase, partial [candidate division Zixibacteria bacterium]|nr:M20/M25/M40 family metallo-hydrolase [candidate division Zixibacteria bacterium]